MWISVLIWLVGMEHAETANIGTMMMNLVYRDLAAPQLD